jgi:predicted solute-binding protein
MKERLELIVGSIVDWPIGKAYADIVSLPKVAHELACYVAIGDEALTMWSAVFRRSWTPSCTR